jgi:predicted transcriptional regulator
MPADKRNAALGGLGETEADVLQHVWKLREATVADVHERISADRPLAYTTVLTVLRNLTAKGLLMSERRGKRDYFTAARSPQTVRGGILSGLMRKLFAGSPTLLVQTLAREESLSPSERDAIRKLLDRMDADDAMNTPTGDDDAR